MLLTLTVRLIAAGLVYLYFFSVVALWEIHLAAALSVMVLGFVPMLTCILVFIVFGQMVATWKLQNEQRREKHARANGIKF